MGKAVLKSRLNRVSSDEGIARDFDDADLVVAFKMNDAGVVLVEEVVGDDQAAVVAAQHQVVRSAVLAEADHRQLLQVGAVRGVQHAHLPGLEHAENQPVAALRSGQDLAHSAADAGVYVRRHGRRQSNAATPVPAIGSIR